MLELKIQYPLATYMLQLSLQVQAGEVVALLGSSGAGKTTLLKVIAGILRPKCGRIAFQGRVWFDQETRICLSPQQRGCGYVSQDCVLFDNMTVWRNVAFGLTKLSRHHKRQQAEQLLQQFGLQKFADRYPNALSGGERQRVALARTFAVRPQLLLLDEPLTALDPHSRQQASTFLVESIRKMRCLTILVTHSFAQARALADRVIVVDHGTIIQTGHPSELIEKPVSTQVERLLDA